MCGGTESMSQAPYFVNNIRFGTKLGEDPKLVDALWHGLSDSHIKTPMAITAENLAEKYQLTREECDKYALQSQTRWKEGYYFYFHSFFCTYIFMLYVLAPPLSILYSSRCWQIQGRNRPNTHQG